MKRYKLVDRLRRLEEQLKDADRIPNDLYSIKILNTKLKYLKKYKYIAFDSKDLEETLLDNIITAIANNDKSYFIKYENTYLGFLSYWLDKTQKIVDGIIFFNFSGRDDTNEMFKDTLTVLAKLRFEYDEINFYADPHNFKANKIYKIYCKKHHGHYEQIADFLIKYTVPGKKTKEDSYRLRETLGDEDHFTEIFGY